MHGRKALEPCQNNEEADSLFTYKFFSFNGNHLLFFAKEAKFIPTYDVIKNFLIVMENATENGHPPASPEN